jgi:hypothetical protein
MRIAEAFGWQPGIWGGFFLIVACFFWAGPAWPADVGSRSIILSSAALGLFLAGHEVRRRRNRTVLVKDGERIAVFRKGRLDLVLPPGELAAVKADLVVVLKIGVPLGLAAVLFTSLGILVVTRDKAVSDGLLILTLGVACWASLASAAWTRFRCTHFRLPIKGSKWIEESVLIPRSRCKELFTER